MEYGADAFFRVESDFVVMMLHYRTLGCRLHRVSSKVLNRDGKRDVPDYHLAVRRLYLIGYRVVLFSMVFLSLVSIRRRVELVTNG